MIYAIENWMIALAAGPGAYVGLFLFGAIAATLVPLSPEVAAIAVWKAGLSVPATIIVLTLGNYAGNSINYLLGRLGEYWILKRWIHIKKERLERARKLFEKYGPPILLLSWVPIIGDPLTFVPGILRYSFLKFSLYVIIGKTIAFIALYWLVSWWV